MVRDYVSKLPLICGCLVVRKLVVGFFAKGCFLNPDSAPLLTSSPDKGATD